jgi:hypothetical protein
MDKLKIDGYCLNKMTKTKFVTDAQSTAGSYTCPACGEKITNTSSPHIFDPPPRLAITIQEMRNKIRIAHELAVIARDWDLTEVEIDGEWITTYELADLFDAARQHETRMVRDFSWPEADNG